MNACSDKRTEREDHVLVDYFPPNRQDVISCEASLISRGQTLEKSQAFLAAITFDYQLDDNGCAIMVRPNSVGRLLNKAFSSVRLRTTLTYRKSHILGIATTAISDSKLEMGRDIFISATRGISTPRTRKSLTNSSGPQRYSVLREHRLKGFPDIPLSIHF